MQGLGRVVWFVAVVSLVAGLAAQDEARTVEALRKENAALRKQVRALQARLAEKERRAATAPAGRIQWSAGVRSAVGVRHVVSFAKRDLRLATELFFDGAFSESVTQLNREASKLNGCLIPANARKIVDRIERILIDVRRAIWLLERAARRDAKRAAGRPGAKHQLFFSFRRF